MSLSYGQIKDRLELIEAELGEVQTDLAKAAVEFHRLARDYELRHALALKAAQASTVAERKALATIALAAADDGIYVRYAEAEGAYEGARAVLRALETRASIGMSLLKAYTREPFVEPSNSKEIAWSGTTN